MSSLARKTDPVDRKKYQGYLLSNAWRKRRRIYFESVREAGFIPACQACFATQEQVGALDLHHLSYEGVTDLGGGRYQALERPEDLLPMCRGCHEHLHQVLDTHRRSFWGWDRHRATVVIISYMRKKHMRSAKGNDK